VLGDELRKLRKSRKLTQKELANKVGMSRGTYAHYEINKRQPDYETLQIIADFFGVSTDRLLGRTGGSSNENESSNIEMTFTDGEKSLNEAIIKGAKVNEIREKFNFDITDLTDDELEKIIAYVRVSRAHDKE